MLNIYFIFRCGVHDESALSTANEFIGINWLLKHDVIFFSKGDQRTGKFLSKRLARKRNWQLVASYYSQRERRALSFFYLFSGEIEASEFVEQINSSSEKFSRRLKMLQQFLWFVPLEFGAYFVGLTAALASIASMLHEWSFLQTAGMNQGNFGFLLIYFASSLLLLNGVRRVRLHSIADSFNQFPWKFSETLQTVQSLLNWKVWI